MGGHGRDRRDDRGRGGCHGGTGFLQFGFHYLHGLRFLDYHRTLSGVTSGGASGLEGTRGPAGPRNHTGSRRTGRSGYRTGSMPIILVIMGQYMVINGGRTSPEVGRGHHPVIARGRTQGRTLSLYSQRLRITGRRGVGVHGGGTLSICSTAHGVGRWGYHGFPTLRENMVGLPMYHL